MAGFSLLAAACGGGEDSAPTTEASVLGATVTTAVVESSSATVTVPATGAPTTPEPTATSPATTTTAATTTTTTSTTTTTEATTTTLPATIVAATFDFSGGPGPKFVVAVSVGPTSDGPWEEAGESPGPVIDAPELYVRFDFQSLDTLGFMTELQVDSDTLGPDLCPGLVSEDSPLQPDVPPGNPAARVVCVAGPFPTLGGAQTVAFVTPENAGYRQGDDRGFFSQAILPPAPVAGEHAFTFYFEPAAGNDTGKAVSGNTPAPTAELGIGLSGPVTVDCSDLFAGDGGGFSDDPAGAPSRAAADPGVVAFAIWTYDAGGSLAGRCENIPRFDDPFDNVDGPDGAFFYTGAAP